MTPKDDNTQYLYAYLILIDFLCMPSHDAGALNDMIHQMESGKKKYSCIYIYLVRDECCYRVVE